MGCFHCYCISLFFTFYCSKLEDKVSVIAGKNSQLFTRQWGAYCGSLVKITDSLQFDCCTCCGNFIFMKCKIWFVWMHWIVKYSLFYSCGLFILECFVSLIEIGVWLSENCPNSTKYENFKVSCGGTFFIKILKNTRFHIFLAKVHQNMMQGFGVVKKLQP